MKSTGGLASAQWWISGAHSASVEGQGPGRVGGTDMKTGVSVTSLRRELSAESNRLAKSLAAAHGLGLTVTGGFLWAGWVGIVQNEADIGWRLLDGMRPGIALWSIFTIGFVLASLSILLRLLGLTKLLDQRSGPPASQRGRWWRHFRRDAFDLVGSFKVLSGVCLALALALVTLMAVVSVVVANEHRAEAATTGHAAIAPAAQTPQTVPAEPGKAPPTVAVKETAPWPLPAMLIGTLYLGLSIAILWIAVDSSRRARHTQWWDRSTEAPNGRLSWADVRALMDEDPLEFKSKPRPWWNLWKLFLAAILAFGWVLGWIFLYDYSTRINSTVLRNVGLGVGGLGIFLTLLGVIYTGRVNTRSANRQAWISDLRNELAAIVEALPRHEPGENMASARRAARRSRAKVELLLNPRERDHRALVAMIRHFFGYENIEIDRKVRQELGIEDGELACQNIRKERKSQLIRLINAVLKREWEQVKLVR